MEHLFAIFLSQEAAKVGTKCLVQDQETHMPLLLCGETVHYLLKLSRFWICSFVLWSSFSVMLLELDSQRCPLIKKHPVLKIPWILRNPGYIFQFLYCLLYHKAQWCWWYGNTAHQSCMFFASWPSRWQVVVFYECYTSRGWPVSQQYFLSFFLSFSFAMWPLCWNHKLLCTV